MLFENEPLIAIVFDTETNGVPKNYQSPMSQVDNWPRVSQLAWQKINVHTGEVLNQHQSLIKPNGWTIPTVEEQKKAGAKDPYFFVNNGMSTERCEAEGVPMPEAMQRLIDDMNTARILVAHNIQFDSNIVGAEMIRLNMQSEKKLHRICTMLSTTKYCALPRNKWPKLMELHQKLFGCGFDSAHDAMADVSATAKCFVELVKRGVISLQHLS